MSPKKQIDMLYEDHDWAGSSWWEGEDDPFQHDLEVEYMEWDEEEEDYPNDEDDFDDEDY